MIANSDEKYMLWTLVVVMDPCGGANAEVGIKYHYKLFHSNNTEKQSKKE